MATYELEPCPCCGAPGQMKDIHNKIRQGWVGCPECGLYIQWKISPDGAIAKWNNRAAGSMTVALTPAAMRLLKYMPGAVNALAERLLAKLGDAVLYGDFPDVRTGVASPAPTNRTEVIT